MENCLKDNGVLGEAPKFARVFNETGILRFRDWAGSRKVLDAVRTLRLIVDIVLFCFRSMRTKFDFSHRQIKKQKNVEIGRAHV